MKFNLICGAALAVLFSASAGAQTCAGPDTSWHPDTSGTPALGAGGTLSTCGHETALISACQAGFGAPGAAYIAQVTTSASGTYTSIAVSGDTAAFTPTLYVVRTTAAGACDTAGGDTGTCQTSSSIAVQAANIPPGDYYLIVTGADFDSAGACGQFQLTANGSLPVSLQSFTVG